MEMIGDAHETAVRDTTIAWGEMGSGPPLVLIHGIQDSHRAWRRAAPFLARRFRVLMPDLPGHGFSGRPDAPYTLTWYAQIVSAWMAEIGVERAHLCGHSFGGGVAQWMVLEQRRRIDRLALVAAGGLGREVAVGMRLATFPVLGAKITPLVLRHLLPVVLKHSSEVFGHMEPEEQERFIRMIRRPGTDRAFQRSVEAVINVFGQYVQTIQRAGEVPDLPPVALFWGAKDPIIPIAHGKKAVANSDNITLTVYQGCGHYPHLDAPERFSRDLADFLRDPNRPAARFRPVPEKRGWRGLLRF
jgi:pimeloyl-ACP methyl ester carboxylesterase